MLCGCQPSEPRAPVGGKYGPLATNGSFNPPQPAFETKFQQLGPDIWNRPLTIVQSCLSPAVLVHCKEKRLALFQGMETAGLGGPTHIAYSTDRGPVAFSEGEELPVEHMLEPWLVVWFEGGRGWTWDVPWVVLLQHRPATVRLGNHGLEFVFLNHEPGHIVLMPLYGYEKLDIQPSPPDVDPKEASTQENTATWAPFLPREMLLRVRYWAAALQYFPIDVQETYRVDRMHDTVHVRQRFDWMKIPSDWETRPVRVAPVRPVIALVSKDRPLPVRFSKTPTDFDYPTPYGAYMGVENVDEYEMSVRLLKFLHGRIWFSPEENETLHGVHQRNVPLKTRAEKVLAEQQSKTDLSPTDLLDVYWLARCAEHLEREDRSKLTTAVRELLERDWLPFDAVLTNLRDANKELRHRLHAILLGTVYQVCETGADFDWCRRYWEELKSLELPADRRNWLAAGTPFSAAMGVECSPLIARARLAYQVGDSARYFEDAFLLTHVWLQQAARRWGGNYVVQHAPWHGGASLQQPVYLTAIRPEARGWSINGPHTVSGNGSHRFEHLFDLFYSPESGAFHRSLWPRKPGITAVPWAEWRQWQAQNFDPVQDMWQPDPKMLAVLLGGTVGLPTHESPESSEPSLESLLAESMLDAAEASERLIPSAVATSWLAAPTRETDDARGDWSAWLVKVQTGRSTKGEPTWPELTWPEWEAPQGGPWTFGRIVAGNEASPGPMEVLRWNGHTKVWMWGKRGQ